MLLTYVRRTFEWGRYQYLKKEWILSVSTGAAQQNFQKLADRCRAHRVTHLGEVELYQR